MNLKFLILTSFVYLLSPRVIFAVVENVTLGTNQPGGIKTDTSVGDILSNVITIMFIAGGLGLVVYFVWGAVDWILAGGDKERISAARKKITQGLVGLALLALSFFIISLFGSIVGFNPLETVPIPRLDDAPVPAVTNPTAR